MTWLALTLALFVGTVSSQDQDCDFFQYAQKGKTYYISSPGYPQYLYQPGKSCRWYAESDPNTKLQLNCGQFNIPSSNGCTADVVRVSGTGDVNLADAHRYCGQGAFAVTSNSNRMNIVLTSPRSSRGGFFNCTFRVVNNQQPPPPTGCSCGWKKQTRIVGGHETGINEYPMMAGVIDANLRVLICGATIIGKRYALTAAHCGDGRDFKKIGLLIGDHNLDDSNETPYSKLLKISNFIYHPSYDKSTQANDIAIIKTQQPIEFRQEIGPACIPFRNVQNSFLGNRVEVLGWGTIDFGGPTSYTLQATDLNIISNSECQNYYDRKKITSSQVCTLSNQGHDSCQSDSGGPILWTDPNTGALNLVGIISYGVACGEGSPSVNTRVTSYLSWITDNTRDENYCVK